MNPDRFGDPRLNKWLDLCERLGAKGKTDYHIHLYNHWTHYYKQPGRYYHVLEHVDECHAKLDEVRSLLEQPDLVELSLDLQDVFNEFWTFPGQNEKFSAGFAFWFAYHLMGLSNIFAEKVHYLIICTDYFSKDRPRFIENNDAKYMMDIDLSGLGARPDMFARNNELVSKEYEWIPDRTLFLKGRLGAFQSLLARSPIYLTPWFRTKYETQAKINLQNGIKELESQLFGPKMAEEPKTAQ